MNVTIVAIVLLWCGEDVTSNHPVSSSELTRTLKEGSRDEILNAIEVITDTKGDALPFVRHLIPLFASDDSDIRSRSREAVFKIGEIAIPEVSRIARDATRLPEEREGAVEILGRFQKRAVDDLIFLIDDHDSKIRRISAGYLVEIPGPRSGEAIKRAVNDPDKMVRNVIAAELRHRESDTGIAIELLSRLIGDADAETQIAAVESLGCINEPNTVIPILRSACQDPFWMVRAEAVRSLSKFSDNADAREAIIDLIKDPIRETREIVVSQIRTAGRKMHSAVDLLADRVQNDPSPSVRQESVYALWAMGSLAERILPILRETAIVDPNQAVRETAQQATDGIMKDMLKNGQGEAGNTTSGLKTRSNGK